MCQDARGVSFEVVAALQDTDATAASRQANDYLAWAPAPVAADDGESGGALINTSWLKMSKTVWIEDSTRLDPRVERGTYPWIESSCFFK